MTGDGAGATSPPGRHHAFTLYWLMAGCGSTANQILSVALGWQVYALTREPLDLGLIGLAQFVPAFLLALPVGTRSIATGGEPSCAPAWRSTRQRPPCSPSAPRPG